MIVGGGRRGEPGKDKGEGGNKGDSIRNWKRCERGTEGLEIEEKYVAGADENLEIVTRGSQTPGK